MNRIAAILYNSRMAEALNIRAERAEDKAAIYAVTEQAFKGRPYADGDEQDLIDRLRESGLLTCSLVATDQDQVVGQITFSPAKLADGSSPWYALGPVSVVPERQGEGIGAALIREGLAQMQARGALGVILTGNPVYYKRFGFDFSPQNTPEREQPEYFMVKRFSEQPIKGRFEFHDAFYA